MIYEELCAIQPIEFNSLYRTNLNRTILEYLKKVKPLLDRYHEFDGNAELRQKYAPTVTNDVTNLQDEYLLRLEDTYKAYLNRLDTAYNITGSKIDNEDLALLNPNVFKMKQEEFNSLVHKHFGNHTMEIALRSYAESVGLFLPNHLMTKKEKEELALTVYRNACAYIKNTTEYMQIDSFMENMAGMLLNEANPLTDIITKSETTLDDSNFNDIQISLTSTGIKLLCGAIQDDCVEV